MELALVHDVGQEVLTAVAVRAGPRSTAPSFDSRMSWAKCPDVPRLDEADLNST